MASAQGRLRQHLRRAAALKQSRNVRRTVAQTARPVKTEQNASEAVHIGALPMVAGGQPFGRHKNSVVWASRGYHHPAENRDMTESVMPGGGQNRVRDAAAAEVGAHRRLMRSGRNARILSGLMLPVFGLWPPAGYGVLTTTGRKTGKRRRKCMRVIRRGRYAYLVALRPPHIAVSRPDVVHAWVWNIRTNPRVRLRLRDGSFAGVAREIIDPAELQEARNTLCDNVYPSDFGECAIHLRGLPTRAKIQRLHRYWFETGIPVVIDLEGNHR